MARYNEIGVGRWNRFIQKLTMIKGVAPAPQLSGEIVFAHPFFHGVENRYLESWYRYGFFAGIQGGAANVCQCRLRNPVSSGIVSVVEQITLSRGTIASPAAILYKVDAQTADLTNVSTPFPLDGRQQAQVATTIVSTTTVGTAPGSAMGCITLLANTSYNVISFENNELPITPGQALTISDFANNQILNFTLVWRERGTEEAERT